MPFAISARSAVTLGMDVMYDASLKHDIPYYPAELVTQIPADLFLADTLVTSTPSINLPCCLIWEPISSTSHFDRSFYFARAGGRIRITDHLAAHICVKSRNGIRSDWIEWGLAYSIKTRTVEKSKP